MNKITNQIKGYTACTFSSDNSVVETSYGVCSACGAEGPYEYQKVINDELARQWGLTKQEQRRFSARESMFCQFCGCSYRLRALARALSLVVAPKIPKSLKDLIELGNFQNLNLAEINSCGVLHDILKAIPKLAYSEYESTDPKIRSEDLTKLSYKDESFDIVLTSDTLEHVPDPTMALTEIARVLKPNGAHVFTIPLRLTKATRIRTRLVGKKTEYLENPSYHGSGEPDYLVWNEFGGDFLVKINSIYPQVKAFFVNTKDLKDPTCVIVAYKRKHPVSVTGTVELLYNPTRQNERLEYIFNKIKLTNDHIKNLEDIIADRTRYIEEQNRLLEEKDSLKHAARLVVGRSKQKIKTIFLRRRK